MEPIRRLPIQNVINQIDNHLFVDHTTLLSEATPEEISRMNPEVYERVKNDPTAKFGRKIDPWDMEKLCELAKKRITQYLTQHRANTKELFVKVETDKAREFQTYFKYWETNSREKTYYTILQNWINCLTCLDNETVGPNNKTEPNENDFLQSTIEDYLSQFKDNIQGDGYNILINAMKHYFNHGNFPQITKIIKTSSGKQRFNKKKLAWGLGCLFKEKSNTILVEHLAFLHENISAYSNDDFDENNYRRSNLYKYMTQNIA